MRLGRLSESFGVEAQDKFSRTVASVLNELSVMQRSKSIA
jgi:hypothetical protein